MSKTTKNIALEQIDLESEEGTPRPGPLDAIRIKELVIRLKGGDMDPVLLWRNPDDRDAPLIILDGRHRIAAYRSLNRKRVKARVIECPFRDALLHSGEVHKRDQKALTSEERANFAWRLVRLEGYNYSKSETANASGVSEPTVGRMRKRLKEMQESDQEPTGVWWKDRQDNPIDDEWEPPTDEEQEETIRAMVKTIRDVLDRRQHEDPKLWDEGLRLEALARALGERTIKELFEFTCGGIEDEREAWPNIATGASPNDDPHAEQPF